MVQLILFGLGKISQPFRIYYEENMKHLNVNGFYYCFKFILYYFNEKGQDKL